MQREENKTKNKSKKFTHRPFCDNKASVTKLPKIVCILLIFIFCFVNYTFVPLEKHRIVMLLIKA